MKLHQCNCSFCFNFFMCCKILHLIMVTCGQWSVLFQRSFKSYVEKENDKFSRKKWEWENFSYLYPYYSVSKCIHLYHFLSLWHSKRQLFYPLRWLIYVFNPVVNTKLPTFISWSYETHKKNSLYYGPTR